MATGELAKQRDELVRELRRGRTPDTSAYTLAQRTVTYLRKFIASQQTKYTGVNELLHLIRMERAHLARAAVNEPVVENMILRVMKLVREEYVRVEVGIEQAAAIDHDQTLTRLWDDKQSKRDGRGEEVDIKALRMGIITTLGEFLQELEMARDSIAQLAGQHIQPRDTVITYGHSRTVASFLKAAAQNCRYRLIIGQNAPSMSGERLAEELKKSESKTTKIDTTIVPDTHLHSQMALAQKVFLPAHAVLADGGLLAPAGALPLCLAARKYAVPVIVLAAFYKLTPKFNAPRQKHTSNKSEWHGQQPLETPPNTMDMWTSALDVVSLDDSAFIDKMNVVQSTFDYIPPDMVSLYLMQPPGNAPSYVYRLLGEYYHQEDVDVAA